MFFFHVIVTFAFLAEILTFLTFAGDFTDEPSVKVPVVTSWFDEPVVVTSGFLVVVSSAFLVVVSSTLAVVSSTLVVVDSSTLPVVVSSTSPVVVSSLLSVVVSSGVVVSSSFAFEPKTSISARPTAVVESETLSTTNLIFLTTFSSPKLIILTEPSFGSSPTSILVPSSNSKCDAVI